MSNKKIYTTVGLDKEIRSLLDEEAKREQRSRGFIVEQVLKKHYEEEKRADKA